jgi:acyl-coenzyme A synthetase/AMP-(fatty) acid ligase
MLKNCGVAAVHAAMRGTPGIVIIPNETPAALAKRIAFLGKSVLGSKAANLSTLREDGLKKFFKDALGACTHGKVRMTATTAHKRCRGVALSRLKARHLTDTNKTHACKKTQPRVRMRVYS